jgi:hypothetical protein
VKWPPAWELVSLKSSCAENNLCVLQYSDILSAQFRETVIITCGYDP